jgi:hypothetical protein
VKIFLSRWTSGGFALDIARGNEGSFHVLSAGEELAKASTLAGVQALAAALLPDGADHLAGWYVVNRSLGGPVYDWANGERRSSVLGPPHGAERRGGASRDS